MKKTTILLLVVLIISLSLNVYCVHGIIRQQVSPQESSYVGTYVMGSDEQYYDYMVLDENMEYTRYSQEKGIEDTGEYSIDDSELILRKQNGNDEERLLYETDRLIFAKDNNLMIYRKQSDIPTYINLD